MRRVSGRRLKLYLTVTAGAVLVTGTLVSSTSAVAAQPAPRVPIPLTHPSWATAAARVQATVPATSITVSVYLAGPDRAGLAAYATEASTPGSPVYRQFLTPAQVQARFGPTAAEVSAVTNWLTGAGLTVLASQNGIGGFVRVQGSADQVASAFGVTFGLYRGTGGQTYRAPTTDASAPADVAADVLSVSGLDSAPLIMTRGDTLPPPGSNFWIGQPCSNFYGEKVAVNEPSAYGIKQPWALCGYTPKQTRSAYGVTSSGMTGRGQTIAVVDAYASPTMLADANQFAQQTGDRTFAAGQYREVLASTFTDTSDCGAAGWYSEESLDVEQVHGQAPDANVVYVGASSCQDSDLLASLVQVVDNHLASIVSDSWGEPFDQAAPLVEAYEQVFQAGSAEGIGFFFSSGDSGYNSPGEDASSDQLQVNYPASSPFITSVGGTSLAVGPFRNYEFETSWGVMKVGLSADGSSWSPTPPGVFPQSYRGSGGGGVSSFFAQPAYQARVVPASLATALPDGTTSAQPMRVVPDVAAVADANTGVAIGQTTLQPDGTTFAFAMSRIGGTSVACPLFAGIEADAQQAAGADIGLANPAIYQRSGTLAFRDVTDHPFGPVNLAVVRPDYTNPSTQTGPFIISLRTLGINGEGAAALPAVRGYDDATGVGSPRFYVQSFFLSRF